MAWWFGKVDRVKNNVGTIKSLEKSLNLDLEYVDLYLIHSPHAKGKRLEQWETLLSQQEMGKIKHIGVSNWGINHLEELKEKGYPLPDANQMSYTHGHKNLNLLLIFKRITLILLHTVVLFHFLHGVIRTVKIV